MPSPKFLEAISKVGKTAEELKDAEKILEAINTPEKALALKGADRAQYLEALDAVHGPRQQRARDLGFDDDVFYHGSGSNIDKFDKAKRGATTGDADAKKAFFFSDSPDVASEYAGLSPTGQTTYPVKLKLDDALPIDFAGNRYSSSGFESALNSANRENASGALIENVKDRVAPARTDSPQTVAAVFEPQNIRSTNAAFDPRFKDSPYLLSASGRSEPIAKGLSTGDLLKKAYQKYNEGVSGAAGFVADKLLDLTAPPDAQAAKTYKEVSKPGLALGLEFAGDPLNFISAPASVTAKIAKGAKAVERGVQAVDKAADVARAVEKFERAPEAVVEGIQHLQGLDKAQKAKITEYLKHANKERLKANNIIKAPRVPKAELDAGKGAILTESSPAERALRKIEAQPREAHKQLLGTLPAESRKSVFKLIRDNTKLGK